jgi:hypothetical protein
LAAPAAHHPTPATPSSTPAAPSSTTTASAANSPASGGGARGSITGGNSKAHCVTASTPNGVITQSIINGLSSTTGITYNCLNVFVNPMPAWSDWDNPWPFRITSDGWDAWLAASSSHQVIMVMDLIPKAVSNNRNPLTWEQPCANGSYKSYATTLAKNLVSYGAGSIVIRLGVEANGSWEADYVGTTSAEMSAWAKCYANVVTAMRAVSGTNFLFVWNANVCTGNIALSKWYPGNSYVDIIGADAYDQDCQSLKTVGQEGWQAFAADSSTRGSSSSDFPSLTNIAAFAASHGKPMSFPEWGLLTGVDDPAYVTGVTQMFQANNFSFESYFDANDDGVAALGSSIPKSTAVYVQTFG